MKASTAIGIILGFLAIFGAFIWEGGQINTLIMLPAMLIVFGGTLAAGLAGTSMEQILKMPKLIWLAFFPPHYNQREIIDQIVDFATVARREGILAVESKLIDVKHPFLRKLFTLCIDGIDPESLQKTVESEISFVSNRHNTNINFFVKLGGYSPTMGIIGTVMGLIATLAAAGSDPNTLIHHIASAFIATMWGIFMANIVWLPIGDKLKTMHNEEMSLFQLMLEGVMAVQVGETPSVIRNKLIGSFPLKEQQAILEEQLIKQASFAKHQVYTTEEVA